MNKVDTKYTVDQLKQICRERGIKGYSKLRKPELINLINNGPTVNQPVVLARISPKNQPVILAPVSPRNQPVVPAPVSPRSQQIIPAKISPKDQLLKYIQYMNQEVKRYYPIVEKFDFQFFSNMDEGLYEAKDFFDYHWLNPNKGKIDRLNKLLGFDAFMRDETGVFEESKISGVQDISRSSFVVVSVGSSSTQIYMIDAGEYIVSTYEFGTNNFKRGEFGHMMIDIQSLDANVLFINSIGFGIKEGVEFLFLANHPTTVSDTMKGNDIIAGSAGDLITKIDNWLQQNPDSEEHIYVVVNQNIKPKLRNKWTNAIAMEKEEKGHSFFVDYGGGKVSVNHVLDEVMDEDSLLNFKYDQDPIVEYYKQGYSDIPLKLYENKNQIVKSIEDYINNKVGKISQTIFPVLVRQTGKLREFYFSR